MHISALNPTSRHNLTLTMPRVVLVGRTKVFISRKVVPLARVTETTLSPPFPRYKI